MTSKIINLILSIFFISFIFGSNQNSIYFFSKSTKTFSLSNIHYISKNIDGLFYQPISKDLNLEKNFYISFAELFNNQFNVIKIGYCLKSTNKNKLSLGFIKRNLDDLFYTNNAWNYSELLSPELSDIEYDSISDLDYEDFGFIFSYDKYFNEKIINLKFKPYFNKIHSNTAYGFDLDFFYATSFLKFDFIIGIENLISKKKWTSGLVEENNLNYFFSNTLNLRKIRLIHQLNSLNSNQIAVDYNINNFFNFRFGFSNENQESIGFGIETDFFDIDYAYFNNQFRLGKSTQISLLFKNI